MPSSRADTDLLAREGLSEESAAERARQGLLNKDATPPTKSIGRIVLDNTFTLFNLVILVLGGAILAVGSYKNALFMGIMVVNTLVGIVQEVRTKRVMDRLSILSAARVQVVRGGAVKPVGREQVVLGDVMELCRGDQIVADCQLLTGACEVSEAMLTGESDPVHKKPGDTLLSGSFLVSGGGRALVTEVGQAGYAARISGHQTRTERPQSQIYGSVRRIIKAVSVAIVPVGALFLYSQLSIDGATVQQAIVSTAAALVGMIPEGLVLLTTSVLAVGVIRLARHRVMVQELVCIEQLARVDVLCLDKTGTITQGQMKLEELVCADGQAPPWTRSPRCTATGSWRSTRWRWCRFRRSASTRRCSLTAGAAWCWALRRSCCPGRWTPPLAAGWPTGRATAARCWCAKAHSP